MKRNISIFEKDDQFLKLLNAFTLYNLGKISDDEALKRLSALHILDNLEEKVLLKEMSIVNTIVDYINRYDSIIKAHNNDSYTLIIKPTFALYFSELIRRGVTYDKYSYTTFIKDILKTNLHAKEEFKKVKNVAFFWEFIADIEKYIIQDIKKNESKK
jgi:hypothetical protein